MGAGRSTLKKILWIVLWAAALGLAIVLLVTDPAALGGWLALGLGTAVVLGMAVRMVRTPRGKKLREALGPVAGAAETYQELLISREPTQELIQHAFPTALDQTAGSEPPHSTA